MIRTIRENGHLKPHIKDICEDEGIRVKVDSKLTEKDYAIIKVDEY